MATARVSHERRQQLNAREVVLRLNAVHKSYGNVRAVAGVDLAVRAGEFVSLLGPSGCGKTTLLRMIAGFEEPDRGSVEIGGLAMAGVPPERRPVNTVFQSYALFPHLNVWQNVAFGLRMQGVAKDELTRRVQAALDLVAITELAQRRVQQISGGQRQRVALARALVNEPRVLLLDEPLAALDRKLRKQLQIELMRLQARLGITFIYVTHDQEEALVMSDRIAVMEAGCIRQVGEPEAVYERPADAFVAGFLGAANITNAQAIASDCVETPWGRLRVNASLSPGSAHGLAIRPEKILLSRTPHAVGNSVAAVVEDLVYTGSENHYVLRVGAHTLSVVALNRDVQEVGQEEFHVGEAVHAHLPAASLVLLDHSGSGSGGAA